MSISEAIRHPIILIGGEATPNHSCSSTLLHINDIHCWGVRHAHCIQIIWRHGRIEARHDTTVSDVDWFEEKSRWAKSTSFGMIESEREVDGHITVETRYFISSPPNDAKRFAEVARG